MVQTPTGIRLRVHIQLRAARTEILGLYGAALKVRLAARPVDGAANEALVRLLAQRLGIPRSAVRIESGMTSRSKILAVDGVNAADGKRLLGL